MVSFLPPQGPCVLPRWTNPIAKCGDVIIKNEVNEIFLQGLLYIYVLLGDPEGILGSGFASGLGGTKKDPRWVILFLLW